MFLLVCRGTLSNHDQLRHPSLCERVTTHNLPQHSLPGRHLVQVQERHQPLPIPSLSANTLYLTKRHSERAEQDSTGSLFVDTPGAGRSRFGMLQVPSPGGGVEDGHGPRTPLGLEDPRQLFVIVGHHLPLQPLFGGGEHQQPVDILDGSEGLLPELQLDGDFELLEPRLEEPGERVRVAKVDRVGLLSVLLRVEEVLAELLGQTTELGFTRVGTAEPKGLEGDLLRECPGVYNRVSKETLTRDESEATTGLTW